MMKTFYNFPLVCYTEWKMMHCLSHLSVDEDNNNKAYFKGQNSTLFEKHLCDIKIKSCYIKDLKVTINRVHLFLCKKFKKIKF